MASLTTSNIHRAMKRKIMTVENNKAPLINEVGAYISHLGDVVNIYMNNKSENDDGDVGSINR